MRVLLVVAALLVSATVAAHSIEPGSLRVLVVDGYTEFPVYAVNRYPDKTTFVVEVYEGDQREVQADFVAVPSRVTLGQHNRAQVFVKIEGLTGDVVRVCTRSEGEGADMHVAIQTRVCSIAKLVHRAER